MDYTVEKLEKSQIKFSYTIDANAFEGAVAAVYQRTKGRYNVPGFRKGHAPRKVIEGMYGPGVFFTDAINDLVDKSLEELDASGEYRLVAVESVTDVDFLDDGGVKYAIIASVRPEVELGAYKGIELAKKAEKVTEKQIDEYINNQIEKQARLVDIDGEAQNGNTVVLDFVGSVDGKEFAGGSAKQFELELGSGRFIPGFEEQLVGIKAGEERDVKVTFPTDYAEPTLAGKDAVFHCAVSCVKNRELPALDDEFVKDISEFDTVADYRADVKKTLVEQADARAERNFEDELVEKIVENANIGYIPEAMITAEEEDMLAAFERQCAYQGIKLDDYFKYTGLTKEQVLKDYEEPATKTVKTRLVMEAIVEAENIGVENSEIDEMIANIAEQQGMDAETYKKRLTRDIVNNIVNTIISKKLMDMLKGACVKPAAKKAAKKQADEQTDAEAPVEAKDEKPAAKPAKKPAAKKPASDAPKAE